MEQLRALDDTICAISTPPGIGGIAVIRVSGSNAIPIVGKAWRGVDLAAAKSHTAHLGTIVDTDQRPLDQVVATIFRAPHTFTGEDVIEISCHGSVWIQQQIVATLIACGCRAATGGEFTRRAFMNGKIDLSQAEAIADVIASSSKAAHKIAISQMRGDFRKMIQSLRDTLLEFCALLELELDFSEEEVEFADRQKLTDDATHIHNTLTRLASSFKTGDAIKNGFPVAIVGETNTGKSTLLNRLLRDDRALVSDIRGTTRDTIDGTITIDGILFRFIDTAGIRQTTDAIENLGIERAFQKIDQAQIIIWLIDTSAPIEQIDTLAQQILPRSADKKIIAAINKIDIADADRIEAIQARIRQLAPEAAIAHISAKNGINIEQLETLIARTAQGDYAQSDIVITNARHYEALTLAAQSIERAIDGLRSGISGDFVAQDIRETIHHLSSITGEITTDQILGTIFSRFCIGK
ncbi:MAG: tRNA uridine-5-carboxymethylaminomethyl(34) synthesis GTPase MnmE [Bacteroidales bacterium]|nr:tRNA uridine-5-carboxymethylaminomethyl(34) synthesis GTPase MnmE [Bacteroidales bacterium]